MDDSAELAAPWREGEGEELWVSVVEATSAAQASLASLARAEAAAGEGLEGALSAMAELHATEWEAEADVIASVHADEDVQATIVAFVKAAAAASSAMRAWRIAMRCMGEAASVPIEPATQTALIDATEALPGVLAAAVPGGESWFIDGLPRFLLFQSCQCKVEHVFLVLWYHLPQLVDLTLCMH
jgi:phosphomevalonate kinase